MAEHKPRKRWIKLWTQEFLYGTTSKELSLESQAVFLKFLALAGDSPIPGTICVAPNVPHTDDQLCKIFNCTPKQLSVAREECVKYGKIKLNSECIVIANWKKYQDDRSEYMREYMQRYREEHGKPNRK